MAETTGVEWADATVNIWEGCTKISDACRACYAETNSPVRAMEMRIGDFLQVEPDADGKRRLKMWGIHGFRYETASWESALRRLNKKAARMRMQWEAQDGTRFPYQRPRVFINSLSDTFEDWTGPVYRLNGGVPEIVANSLDDVRRRFFAVAAECTELDLLLLTKRPENILRMVASTWLPFKTMGVVREWPKHIWVGTTVENQKCADERVPELLKVPAAVRFLSVEPLLDRVALHAVAMNGQTFYDAVAGRWRFDDFTPLTPNACPYRPGLLVNGERISWIIVGCESGRNPRETKEEWVRDLRDQCVENGVRFFYKQAMANGDIVSLPMLDGRQWKECPVTP